MTPREGHACDVCPLRSMYMGCSSRRVSIQVKKRRPQSRRVIMTALKSLRGYSVVRASPTYAFNVRVVRIDGIVCRLYIQVGVGIGGRGGGGSEENKELRQCSRPSPVPVPCP